MTVWKPSHFPTRLEIHAKGIAWRTFVVEGRAVGVRIEDRKTVWACTVFAVPREWTEDLRGALLKRLRAAYGLDDDDRGFVRFCAEDARLSRLAGPCAGMRGSCPENVFELAVLAILLQNTTMRRSRDMLDAVLRLSGRAVRFDGLDLLCFCTPESLCEVGASRLRQEARVGYRDRVLVSVADFFRHRPTCCPEGGRAGLMELLCRIKGVGPYTAGIVASSVFRDPRAYGLDVWKRKIITSSLELDGDMGDQELRAHLASRYAPYEGLVVDLLVERACMGEPVCPVYGTADAARTASRSWPRPPA